MPLRAAPICVHGSINIIYMTNEKEYESIKSRFIVIPFIAIPQRAVPIWAYGSINVHDHVTHDIMSYERCGDLWAVS